MRELKFDGLSPDGTRLILAGNDGQKWSVVIDERIEAAVRRDRARIGQVEIEQAGMLRPREIQARIRSGQTAEDVAAASGLPIEHIRRFEGPVLTERAWVAQQAQATEVRRPGGDIELGDLVSERLHAEDVDPADIAWDAWRRDDGTWVVIATFPLPPNTHVATWTYDSGSRTMTVVDDNARSLSAIDPQAPLRLAASRPMLATVAPIEDDESGGEDHEPAAVTSLPAWGHAREELHAGAGPGPEDELEDDEALIEEAEEVEAASFEEAAFDEPTDGIDDAVDDAEPTATDTETADRTPRSPRTTARTCPPDPDRPRTPRMSRCSTPPSLRPTGPRASPACRASTTSSSGPGRASSRRALSGSRRRPHPRHAAGRGPQPG